MTTIATQVMLDLARQWDAAVPSAVFSGIVGDAAHQTDPGKHLSWADNRARFGSGAWPLSQSAGDVNPPNKSAAAAIDMNMNRADQDRVHNRFIALYRARATDPRARYVTAFNGWNGSGQPMRYVLTNGATAVTDSSHTWHEHVEVPYDQVDQPVMIRAIMSVIRGETAAQFLAAEKPAPAAEGEDEMALAPQNYEIPRGYAFAPDGTTQIDKSKVLLIGAPPVGLKGHPYWAGRTMFLSVGSDFSDDGSERLRVAIHNGSGWSVNVINAKDANGREGGLKLPAAGNDTAYKIGISRVAPTDGESKGEGPLFLMVEIV